MTDGYGHSVTGSRSRTVSSVKGVTGEGGPSGRGQYDVSTNKGLVRSLASDKSRDVSTKRDGPYGRRGS